MHVAMPTISERAFTDISLLQQVPAPHAASWRYRSTVAFPHAFTFPRRRDVSTARIESKYHVWLNSNP
jgi:hypothetical protein